MYSPTLNLTGDLQINIKFADTPITITHSAKYLGLIIDSNLDYKQHINMLECKVGELYRHIVQAKKYFSPNNTETTLFCVYTSLIAVCHYYMGFNFFHLFAQTTVQILQHKAVRAVVDAHYHDSAKPILANFQIL